jgi:hypothetical protein
VAPAGQLRPAEVAACCCGFAIDWCVYCSAFLAMVGVFVGVVLLILSVYGGMSLPGNAGFLARLAPVVAIVLTVLLILACAGYATMVCCGCGGRPAKKKDSPVAVK